MRNESVSGGDPFQVGVFRVDPRRNIVSHAGQETHLEPKVIDALAFLAARPCEVVARGELLNAVWPDNGAGDESLTRVISLLRKAFGAAEGGADYIETVPKRGYRLTAPVSHDFSEPMESSSPAETHVRRPAFFHRQKATGFVLLAAAAALIAGALATTQLFSDYEEAAAFDIVIAEFDNQSGLPEGDGLGVAIREGILRELALAGIPVSQKAGARPLRLVVEGSLLPAKDGALVSISFNNAKNDNVLWSNQFHLDDDMDALVQRKIPWHVGSLLHCAVTHVVPGAPPMNAEAFDYYLRSCQYVVGESRESAHEDARRAFEADAENLSALLNYAYQKSWLSAVQIDERKSDDYRAEARRLSGDAIEISPGIARAYLILGILDVLDMKWADAEQRLQKAVMLDPDLPVIHQALAAHASRVGRVREAVDYQRLAVSADPFSLDASRRLAQQMAALGDTSLARDLAREIEVLNPRVGCITGFYVDHWHHHPRDVLKDLDDGCMKKILSADQRACTRAFIKARLGEGPEDKALELCTAHPVYEKEFYPASFGRMDEAFDIAMSAEISWWKPFYLFHPQGKPFRDDPRFMKFAARYGLTDYWLETDQWPDFCLDPGLAYDCRAQANALSADG